MRWLTACLIGLPLLNSGASAQPSRPHEHGHPEVATEDAGSRPLWRRTWADSARADRSAGVSTTPDKRILVELTPEDTTAANLVDLNGRTLIFAPDGEGGYSRSVQSVAWEDDIGRAVADREEIRLQSFTFDFAGRRWGFLLRQRPRVDRVRGPSRGCARSGGEPGEVEIPAYTALRSNRRLADRMLELVLHGVFRVVWSLSDAAGGTLRPAAAAAK